MARAMDLEAPRAGERSVKVGLEDSEKPAQIYRVDLIRESDGQGKWDYNDTWAKVVADRKKWVRSWVERGVPLARVLRVFNPHLHVEIKGYYQQATKRKL